MCVCGGLLFVCGECGLCVCVRVCVCGVCGMGFRVWCACVCVMCVYVLCV